MNLRATVTYILDVIIGRLLRELRSAFQTLVGWTALWGVRASSMAYPGAAFKIAQVIAKVAYQPPQAWAGFTSDYIHQMTGKELGVKEIMEHGAKLVSREFAKNIGEEFLKPMLGLIMPKEFYTDEKALEGAERYLAVNLQFQMNAWLLHFIGDMVSFGKLKSLKDLPNAISWSYGLGWLSWLVMGTPFRISITEPMERYFNRVYRPQLPSKDDLINMYIQGYIDGDEYYDLMAQHGYTDIHAWILAAMKIKDLSDSELKTLLNEKMISEGLLTEYLQARGYTEEVLDIKEWLLKKDRWLSLRDKLLDEVLDLYVYGVLPESQLREYFSRQGYTPDEIELIVSIGDVRKVQRSQPTVAQIRSAVKKDYITEAEARKMLIDRGWDDKWAEIMLRL